jgi:hypothetical protein
MAPWSLESTWGRNTRFGDVLVRFAFAMVMPRLSGYTAGEGLRSNHGVLGNCPTADRELPITPDNARLSAFQLEWLIKRHSNCRNLAEAVDKYYGVSRGLTSGRPPEPPGSGGARLFAADRLHGVHGRGLAGWEVTRSHGRRRDERPRCRVREWIKRRDAK